MLFSESDVRISDGVRYLLLGAIYTFIGIVKLWFWFSGLANAFALWFGVLLCSAGPCFLWVAWRSRARVRDTSDVTTALVAGLLLLGAQSDPGNLRAQEVEPPLPSGVLGHLVWPRTGHHVHYSSHDRTGGNDDFVSMAPGETFTLVDHQGAGILRRWWLTIAPRNDVQVQRGLIVRCYWDGEEEPSVEVPVSDFFGMGFGLWKDYTSLPLNMTSGGYNSYWPMPFKENARIVVENTSDVRIERFYYNIDIEGQAELPEDTLYFHAQFRRAVTEPGKPVAILETSGRGHYVGTLLAMQPRQGNQLGYLEGDELIQIDGADTPAVIGTGTEDYFSSGWYYDTGEYSAPYHGVTIKDEKTGRINSYRWHIEDPIPFDESFRLRMEHGGTNDTPGVVYSSVAYWYQTHPHTSFPPLPQNLLPLSQATAPDVEGEGLAATARATGGQVRTQDMSVFEGTWGGDEQLWWIGAEPGDRLTLSIEAEEAGAYELFGFFTRGPDYGVVRLRAGGEGLRPLVDGYGTAVERSGPVSFGVVSLEEGGTDIVIELLGKDARAAGYSDGYLVGSTASCCADPTGKKVTSRCQRVFPQVGLRARGIAVISTMQAEYSFSRCTRG